MPDQNDQGESWSPDQQQQQPWPTPQGTYLPFTSHDQSIENVGPYSSAVSQRAANPQAQGFSSPADMWNTLKGNVAGIPSNISDLAQQAMQGPEKPEGGFGQYLMDQLFSPAGEVGQAFLLGPAGANPAERELLQIARQFHAQGMRPQENLDITGWYKTPAFQRWIMEHPDRAARFERPQLGPPGDMNELNLTDILRHPELYTRYPELLQQRLFYHRPRTEWEYQQQPLGEYNPGRGGYIKEYNPKYQKNDPFGRRGPIERMAQSNVKTLSTILHEFGAHHPAYREGFPVGSSPGMAGSYQAYLQHPGEVMARAVQQGMGLNRQELRESLPERLFGEFPAEAQKAPEWSGYKHPYDMDPRYYQTGYENPGLTPSQLGDLIKELHTGVVPEWAPGSTSSKF